MNIILEIEDLEKLMMNNNQIHSNSLGILNKIDENKKNNLKSRFIISIFVVIFYTMLVIFSLLADKSEANWFSGSLSNDNIKGIFGIIYAILLYIPFFFSVKEVLFLIYKNDKNIKIGMFCLITIFYVLPLFMIIMTSYFYNFIINVSDKELYQTFSLYSLYILYIIVFFCSITIVAVNLLYLKKINNLSFLNGFVINLLLLLISFGFLGFAFIGITRGWTTIFFLLICVAGTDVCCYVMGILFGKRKMAKTISPNKTWEGAILGTILTLIVTLIYCGTLTLDDTNIKIQTFTPENDIVILNIKRNTILLWNIAQFQTKTTSANSIVLWIIIMFLSVGLIVSSIIGDLLFSYIKRKYNIKDFGNALKSHGGFLDRFDSFLSSSSIYLFYTLTMIGIFATSRNIEILYGVPV